MAEVDGGFPAATAVTAVDDATYAASIPPGWNVPVGIHGGVLLATGVRAAMAALVAHDGRDGAALEPLSLRTVHASFLARPDDPRLGIATSVLRRGATTGHVDLTIRSSGASTDAVSARALFTRSRANGDAWLDAVAPVVPRPDVCAPDIEDRAARAESAWPMAVPPLFENMELRTALGCLPWDDDWEPGLPARYARWCRYRQRPTLPDGAFDPLALLPLADLPGPAVWSRFGPDEPMRLLASLEMTFDVLEPVTDEWILTDFTVRWLGDGYLVADGDVWSAGRLVATLRQTMLVRVVPKP